MSFFGGKSARQSSEEAFAMEMNLRGTTALFNSMSKVCFKKCIPNYHEPDLNVAEYTCIDRCTAKFMQVNESISKVLQQFQEDEMKMQQSMQGTL